MFRIWYILSFILDVVRVLHASPQLCGVAVQTISLLFNFDSVRVYVERTHARCASSDIADTCKMQKNKISCDCSSKTINITKLIAKHNKKKFVLVAV